MARDASVSDLFCSFLTTTDGARVAPDSLRGKIVALYFSAHWCQGCRNFTPALVRFRNENAGDEFETVFVSLDNSDAEKERFIREFGITGLTVPGARSPEAVALARKFGVRKLPKLVILAPDGSIIPANGRSDVATNPEGALRRWNALVSS